MICIRSVIIIAAFSFCASTAPGAIIGHDLEFKLVGHEPATIVQGGIADPGRNTLTFGAMGLPIESLLLSGTFTVRVNIDDTTDTPTSLRFSSIRGSTLIGSRPINYFLGPPGYVHVGAEIEPIPNALADQPQFAAVGKPRGDILPRSGSFTSISSTGVFDADRQSLMVTSGKYIASGIVATAFVIPADAIIDTSGSPLIITSRSHDPLGDKGQISLRRTANGYRGSIEMDLSETFGHLRIHAKVIPEPASTTYALLGILLVNAIRRR